jgi:hypothetical protein
MNLTALILQLRRFESGLERSVQWAKDTETLLDDISEWNETIDELRDSLSVYRPGGGPHLIDDKKMATIVSQTLARLNSDDS